MVAASGFGVACISTAQAAHARSDHGLRFLWIQLWEGHVATASWISWIHSSSPATAVSERSSVWRGPCRACANKVIRESIGAGWPRSAQVSELTQFGLTHKVEGVELKKLQCMDGGTLLPFASIRASFSEKSLTCFSLASHCFCTCSPDMM